jgi:anti-anti-sigma factor
MAEPEGSYLQASRDQGALVLAVTRARIQGEEAAHALREEMLAAVKQAPADKIVVDLQKTTYMSSVAFWPLLALRRHLQHHGGRLVLCGLNEDIEDLFRTTRMIGSGTDDAPFLFAPDRAAAVALLNGPPEGAGPAGDVR